MHIPGTATAGDGGPSPHRLITIDEAARLLACSSMTLRRKIRAKTFPAVCIGSKSLVPRAFVEGLIDQAEAGRTVVVEEASGDWLAAAAVAHAGGRR